MKLGALGALAAVGLGLFYRFRYRLFPVLALSDDEIQATTALIDILIPKDPFSPGALELGVHDEILEQIARSDSYRRILHEGLRWFDGQARGMGHETLLDLELEKQVRLVGLAASSPRDSTANWVYRHLRNDALRGYYSRPEAWTSLCYPGPPQPVGFMDYSDPPAGCPPS